MDIGNRIKRRSSEAYSIAAAAALLLSPASHAAQWTITPSVEASETYTDNVNLTPRDQAKSDFVTQVTPSIAVATKGPNLTLNADYGAQETYYADHNAPASLVNLLHADANAKFIENLLYLDSAASITEQNISAFGAQPADNTNNTTNRASVRTFHISPYLSHTFDTFATTELRYALDTVTSNSNLLSNSNTDTLSFNTKSGPAFRIIGWGLQYSDQVIHYQSQNDVKLQDVTGNLSYLIAPRFRLTASTGYDRNEYAALNGVSEGYSWSGGFEWTVSPRTKLNAAIGRKYYGRTFSLLAATRTRVSNWILSYDESVTTTPSQFSTPTAINTATFVNQLPSAQTANQQIQDGALPNTLTNSVNSFTNITFLQKQLQGSVVLSSPKTTLLLSLFDTQREPLSGQPTVSIALADGKTNQFGASAFVTRRITSLTSANVMLLAARVESLTTGRVDNTQMMTIGLTKQLARKLRGTIEIRRNQGQSNQAGVGYRENAIVAYLNFQL